MSRLSLFCFLWAVAFASIAQPLHEHLQVSTLVTEVLKHNPDLPAMRAAWQAGAGFRPDRRAVPAPARADYESGAGDFLDLLAAEKHLSGVRLQLAQSLSEHFS